MRRIFQFLLLFSPLGAHADLSIHLPLGPWFRPGRYIPVQLTAFHDSGDFFVSVGPSNVQREADIGKGAGRTSIKVLTGRVDAVVPWLVMDRRAGFARASLEVNGAFAETAQSVPLQLLAESDRLVAMTGPHDAFARTLLGNGNLIPVQLDPAQPLRGNSAAWELLNALLLDADAYPRLQPGQLAGLLACGVTVAVRSDTAPDAVWPWQRQHDWWVLKHDPAGPRSSGYHPAAYLPVSNWQAGWPWSFRRRMLLLAVAFALPFLALALWKPRYAAVSALLLSAAIVLGTRKWWELQLAYQQAGGEIIIKTARLTQTDGWTYITATQVRSPSLRWSDSMRPIYASDAGHDDIWTALNCDTSGRPLDFYIRLPARRKLAFLNRSVGVRAPLATPEASLTSPLRELASELYLGPKVRIEGQLPGTPSLSAPSYGYVEVQQWNALVLRREE